MKNAALLLLPFLLGASPPPDIAWDIVEGLTTEVGPRLAGTEAEARARDWAVLKLKSLGFANVHIETFDMPVWVRGTETAEMVAPYPQRLAITALGNGSSTGPHGLSLPVIAFSTLDALKGADPAKVRGKIVYLSHQITATQDGSGYGYFGAARRQGPSVASRLGAAAIIIRSIGTDHSRSPHTGVQNWQDNAKPIPAGAISTADADLLEHVLARGKQVQLKLILTPQNIGVRQSGNVIAEVPGYDPAAGLVVIGGHLDSWDLGTGAIDDGAGLAITAAAAKSLLDSGKKPKRTLRLIWWGAEEVGSLGGADYFKRHKTEPHAFAAESDFGADRIWRLDVKLPENARELGRALGDAIAPLGIVLGKQPAQGGSDIGALIGSGVPAADLKQDGTRYFNWHHTAEDTLDKIERAQLSQNVRVWSMLIDLVANTSEDLMAGQGK
jgi:carboxypeptidase Q